MIAVTLGTEGRHYTGHDGIRQWMRDIRDRFRARTVAGSVTPLADDALLMDGTLLIADPFGDDEEPQQYGMVIHVRGDRVIWIGTFFSAADAKAAYDSGVTGPRPG